MLDTLDRGIEKNNVRGLFYGITFATRFGCSYFGLLLLGMVGDALSIEATFFVILVFNLLALTSVLAIREKGKLEPEGLAGY